MRQRDGGHPVLYIRCMRDDIDLFVAWDTRLSESSAPTTVQHRIDDEPIESLRWNLSNSRESTSLPNDRVASTIRELFNANEFVVQVIPDKSRHITAVFQPAGIYWAVKPVLEACGQEIN